MAKEVLEEVPTQFLEYMEAVKILPANKEEFDFNELAFSKPHLQSEAHLQSKATLGQVGKAKAHSEIDNRKRSNTQEDVKRQGPKKLSYL